MSLTYNQAVEQTITAGEQIHQIVNGTATTEVTVEDGSKVPSVRKALLDNFYFKDPIAWQVGQTENVFNQLRQFTDGSWWYAPSATVSNPISMGSTPVGDILWKIYDFDAIGKLEPRIDEALRRSYAEAGYSLIGTFSNTGLVVNTATDVVLWEPTGIAYSYSGTLPHTIGEGETPVGNALWVPKNNALLRTDIATSGGAAKIGTSDGRTVEQRLAALPSEVDAAGTAATLVAQHNNEALAHPQLSAFITSEADRAKQSADAAAIKGNVYATKALGLAGTPSGQYFNVISGSAGNYIDLYLNNAGVAVLQKTYPSSAALDDWQRKYPGLFLNDPYYEDSGSALYFKPSEFQGSGNYIYIRGGYLASAEFNYDKLKSDLTTSGIPTNCAIGVTSPLGVPDCIKIGGITTMWYEPVSQVFSWGARAPKHYYLKFLEYNVTGVAKCEELPLVVDSKHKTNMVKVDSKIPCQIIPSLSVAPYIPNINVAAKTLTFYADTLIEAGWTRHPISTTTSVDLSVIASSALVVFYDKTAALFVVKAWNYVLSEVERYNYVLVATIRLGTTYANTSMSISCPYSVDGKAIDLDTPLSQPVASVFTPLIGATATNPKLPEYTTATRTFTLYQDTILQTRDLEWALPSTESIAVGSGSTATRVWWNTATNTLETGQWNSIQTANQLRDRVLVATIRHVPTSPSTAVVSIRCPYTVNGKLFGVGQDANSIVHNPLDANIKGIMHRGYSSLAPQNTLPAYKKAAELYNYYVEGDIRWTLDGVPVLLHDETIDATSDGTGAIATMTFAEARAYDFGSWFSPVYVGTPIPSFEEILKSMKKLGLHGFFELKTVVSTAQINALMTILNQTGMFGRIQFDCFFYTVLQEVVSIKPSQNVGLLGSLSSAFIDQCVTLKSGQNKVTAAVDYASVTAELVQEANEKGISVVVWTVDSVADVIAAADKGVDGIMTNSLNIAQVLRENELG